MTVLAQRVHHPDGESNLFERFEMIRRFVGAVAIIAVSVASACATAASSSGAGGLAGKTYHVSYRAEQAKVTHHFDVAADDTWRAIGPAFKDLNYAGGPSADGKERVYMTPTLVLHGRLYEGEWNSDYFDCGLTPAGLKAAESYELTFAVLVWVDADKPDGSSVRILVDGWGRDRANPSANAQCSGTGRLENMFLQAIQRRLSLAQNEGQR
jgi:hypothetical protein